MSISPLSRADVIAICEVRQTSSLNEFRLELTTLNDERSIAHPTLVEWLSDSLPSAYEGFTDVFPVSREDGVNDNPNMTRWSFHVRVDPSYVELYTYAHKVMFTFHPIAGDKHKLTSKEIEILEVDGSDHQSRTWADIKSAHTIRELFHARVGKAVKFFEHRAVQLKGHEAPEQDSVVIKVGDETIRITGKFELERSKVAQ